MKLGHKVNDIRHRGGLCEGPPGAARGDGCAGLQLELAGLVNRTAALCKLK